MYEMGAAEVRAVERVIRRGRFFRYGGRETTGFEAEWCERIGVRNACAVTSGTAALIVGLKAMGIGPGDSVLVPGYTFVSTALAVTAVGAVPILADIDASLTLDPADVERRIAPHTAAMIPVHMQGMPCNLRALRRIARRHGIRMLEDCCQAVGGSYGTRRLGAWGDAGAFSFNQYKILCSGEGGALVTDDARIAERAFMAQDGSCSVWPETGAMSEAFFCGANYRMNELNAAMLRVQVRRLDRILGRLRAARTRLAEGLTPPAGCLVVPSHDEAGNCGVCLLLQAPDVATAERLETALAPHLRAGRPIHSGRHVYSAWDVVRGRVGGHHPDWDCYKHPRNRAIRTNYDAPLPAADDYLARTVMLMTPYDLSRAALSRAITRANAAMAQALG